MQLIFHCVHQVDGVTRARTGLLTSRGGSLPLNHTFNLELERARLLKLVCSPLTPGLRPPPRRAATTQQRPGTGSAVWGLCPYPLCSKVGATRELKVHMNVVDAVLCLAVVIVPSTSLMRGTVRDATEGVSIPVDFILSEGILANLSS